MIVLKYIISFVLAIFTTSFLSIILTVLRVGLPICIQGRNNPKVDDIEKVALYKLQKKYYLSLFLDSIIVIIFFCIVFFLLKETLIFYGIIVLFYLLISFNKTGATKENLMEVDNSISANKE